MKALPKKRSGGFAAVLTGALFASLFVVGGAALVKFKAIPISSELEIATAPRGLVTVEVLGKKPFRREAVSPPFTLNFEPGNHQITIQRLGFKPLTLVHEVPFWGGKTNKTLVLEPEGELGQMRITTVPAGARIMLLNTKDSGTSPFSFEFLPVDTALTFEIQHPKCNTMKVTETLPASAVWQVFQRTYHLRGCR